MRGEMNSKKTPTRMTALQRALRQGFASAWQRRRPTTCALVNRHDTYSYGSREYPDRSRDEVVQETIAKRTVMVVVKEQHADSPPELGFYIVRRAVDRGGGIVGLSRR